MTATPPATPAATPPAQPPPGYRTGPPPRRARYWPAILAGVVVVLLIITVGGLALAASLGRSTRHVQQTYTGVRSVDVQVAAESVDVQASPDDVTRLDRSVSWSFRQPNLSQRQDGDQLVVRSSCTFVFGGCSGRLRLEVPDGVAVRVHSSAGAVRASDVSGDLDLSTSAGSVTATGVRSSTVRASSSAGSVRVDLAVEPQQVTASSSAGSVQVLVPQGSASYRVNADTSAGSESVDVRTDPASDRVIQVHSSAGSVRVGYLP